MKMWELVSWFQMEYPELVLRMKSCNHHLTDYDKYRIRLDNLKEGDPVFIAPDNRGFPKNLNPYHLESDVFTHTMMVCKQAENMPYEVQIAALLHDIGKPSTRAVNPKNGRVSFFNHDAVSAFMSLEILKREELGLSERQIAHIFNLIALHTQVYKLSQEQFQAIGSWQLLVDMIYLGHADHEGRFHSHEGSSLPIMSYETPDKRDTSKLTKEVVILCGLPASGKSTWRSNLRKPYRLVSRDSIIEEVGKGQDYNEKWKSVNQKNIDKLLQDDFRDAKQWGDEGISVVIDMTHMNKKSRRRSLSHFGKDYKKKCVVFLTDLPTNFLRNSQRDGKVIDKEVIDRMLRSFYPPTFEEFDEIEYVL